MYKLILKHRSLPFGRFGGLPNGQNPLEPIVRQIWPAERPNQFTPLEWFQVGTIWVILSLFARDLLLALCIIYDPLPLSTLNRHPHYPAQALHQACNYAYYWVLCAPILGFMALYYWCAPTCAITGALQLASDSAGRSTQFCAELRR